MPKLAREMSALEVGRLREEGDHHVGGVPGLLLRIKGASRQYVLRVRVGDKRLNISLGTFSMLTLSQAREAARKKRADIEGGMIDLLTRRDQRKATAAARAARALFKVEALALIASRRSTWKNAKHAEQWSNTLETYAYPKLADVAIAEITVAQVLDVLQPIWYEKPETASRVRGRIEAVIDYANVKHGLKIENPARWRGNLDVLLPHKAKVRKVKHHKAVPWRDAADVCRKIMERRGVAAKALQAVILTCVRYTEVTGMLKGELMLDEALWVIPAERMKVDRDHYVPLSRQMLALLRSVGADKGEPSELVFGSTQGQRLGQLLSENSLTKVMQKNGIDATTHGWRSTFRDWSAEATSYPNELCEMVLAHTIENKAEAAYRRGDMLDRRRPLMQEWADYVMPQGVRVPAVVTV
jgi:integrase